MIELPSYRNLTYVCDFIHTYIFFPTQITHPPHHALSCRTCYHAFNTQSSIHNIIQYVRRYGNLHIIWYFVNLCSYLMHIISQCISLDIERLATSD